MPPPHVEVLSVVCKYSGGSLQSSQFMSFKYNYVGNGRERAAQGGLQVARTTRKLEHFGKSEGQFNVVLEIVEVSKKKRGIVRKQLWARPEAITVLTHVEDLRAQAAILEASSLKAGDTPHKQAEELKRQALQITFAIAIKAVEAFVQLEKQVLAVKQAAEQDAARAHLKTSDDVVKLHEHVTRALLADGEQILRSLKEC